LVTFFCFSYVYVALNFFLPPPPYRHSGVSGQESHYGSRQFQFFKLKDPLGVIWIILLLGSQTDRYVCVCVCLSLREEGFVMCHVSSGCCVITRKSFVMLFTAGWIQCV